MIKKARVCGCDEHLPSAAYQIDEHVFVLLSRTTFDEGRERQIWSWECSCSSIAGRRTWVGENDQGANGAYHNWLFHVEKRGSGWR